MEIDKELGIEIGTEEEKFFTDELEACNKAIELHEKSIEANKWLIDVYKKRLKDINDNE